MKTKITDLREHLFATLEDLRDKEKPMDLDRAKTISEVAKTIIESAKVEVDMVEVTGRLSGSEFFPDEKPALPEGAMRPKLVHRS